MANASPVPAWRQWLLAASIAGAVAGAVVLYLFDPERSAIFPLCPWHVLTGWSCPGCGTLRALHQLTHGHLLAAWRFNPLTISLIPVVAWLGLRELVWQVSGKTWPGLVTRPAFGWALVAITVLFGIVRNVPGFPI